MESIILVGGVFVVLVIILLLWSRADTNEAVSMSIDEEAAKDAREDAAEGKPPEPLPPLTAQEKAEEEDYYEES